MRRHPHIAWMLVAAALVALVAPVAPIGSRGSRADVVHPEELTGAYRYADGERGLRDIEDAVEHAIRGMPFFILPIAREMVRGRTIHFDELRLDVRGDRVRFATEGWGPITTRLDAPPTPIRAPEGSDVVLSYRFDRAGRLIQLFAHEHGARENTFALSGDREWLWMSVRIFSPRLPRECRYRLRYHRIGG